MTPMPLPDTRAITTAWLRLTLGLGPTRQARALLDHFGDAPTLFNTPAAQLHAHIQAPIAGVLAAPPAQHVLQQIERALAWLAQPNCHFLTLADYRYPAALRASAAPPLALYVAGRPELLHTAGLAIVGTRQPTAVGARDAHDYAYRLAILGLPIVSGLALGIDAAAHTGALAAGRAGGRHGCRIRHRSGALLSCPTCRLGKTHPGAGCAGVRIAIGRWTASAPFPATQPYRCRVSARRANRRSLRAKWRADHCPIGRRRRTRRLRHAWLDSLAGRSRVQRAYP